METIPVYLFVGFLESGKTRFIQETMEDTRFHKGEKTLLLMCEEGEEELNPSRYEGGNVFIEYLEEEEDLTREKLQAWVDYANANDSIILYDSAYEVFISDPALPHSIYEIDGARTCAIEFRSFSKTAGFTGNRCAYTVVPMELERDGAKLNALWNRRQTTKFNGASYLTQRAAAATYTPEGRKQIQDNIDYYLRNARIMREALAAAGHEAVGGINSPYVWVKTPKGMTSWQFFDWLLEECNVAGTPGSGFGPSGEGYFRLTAFNTEENTRRAMERIRNKG